jgi:transcriptional regulator GlxA family with amidase domain
MRLLPFVALALLSSLAAAARADPPLKPAHAGALKVAFVLSEHATVIDFAGPWDVFESAQVDDSQGGFELYTVAPSKEPLHTSGGKGFTVVPDYDFDDAPMPDIVVIGAQQGGPGLDAWLQKVHQQGHVILSVCTGAFKVAHAGLLDGKQATTHHDYYDSFSSQYPKVDLVRDVRYVKADPTILVAGGEMSGVDLSLHLLAEYYGETVARRTADYMEYQGTGWKTNKGVTAKP